MGIPRASIPDLVDYIRELLARGFDLIPCRANTKQPLYAEWQQRDPAEQMQQALDQEADFNLAVRGGGPAGLVILDCEDEDTTQAIVDWLDGVHIDGYPIVRSASGAGSHIWLKCDNIPSEFTAFCNLDPLFGNGEVRAGHGAYAMIPPSYAWSDHGECFGHYTFFREMELYDEMDPVDWSVVIEPLTAFSSEPVLSLPEHTPLKELTLPIPLPYQPAPPLVYTLLDILQTAPQGQPIFHPNGTREPYASRSEAEEAIITILILCGWPYAEIQRLFEDGQPGHYRDIPAAAEKTRYLETSYRNALIHLVETPERQPILAAYAWAYSSEWPLNSGLPRLVYHHILLTAYKDARFDPVVPYSTLRAATGASNGGLSVALDRLEEAGLILRLPAQAGHGDQDRILVVLDAEKSNYSHRGGIYTKSFSLWGVTQLLGQESYIVGYVYCALCEEAQSIAELAAKVGSSRDTVSMCLRALEKLGLAVQVHRYGWVVGEADIEELCPMRWLRGPVEAQESLVGVKDVLEELERLGGELERAGMVLVRHLGVELPDPDLDPVAAYVHVMSRVFGCHLQPSNLSIKHQEQLQGLVLELEKLYRSGRLRDPSVYAYILWVARTYKSVARERGWPMVWVNVVTSGKVLAWYAAEHPSLRPVRIVPNWGQPILM